MIQHKLGGSMSLNRKVIIITFFLLLLTPLYAGDLLRGSGATFPYPLYEAWLKDYQKISNVRIDYEATGSGEGIRQLLIKTKDFGGTDAYLESTSSSSEIVHIPTCLGAIAIIYNVPGFKNLKLSPQVLSSIFLGKIKNWNHKEIARINEGKLPDKSIALVHRSDGSGSTFIMTDYLSRISGKWEKEIGRGKTLRWPHGIGAEGNPGVAEYVGKIQGSIGYVELTYAHLNELPVASLKNRSGYYIKPTLSSVSAAANIQLPEDMRVMITNTSSTHGYPISAFTYLICYKDQNYNSRSFSKANALVNFLMWTVNEGQSYNAKYFYAPLPKKAAEHARNLIKTIHYGQKPILDVIK